jgi:hypothetical protein
VPSADIEFFLPAETEIEAIERIYALTGRAPESVRGGSRAGKRALVALRDALDLDIDIVRTPAAMARDIAMRLDVQWREDLLVDLNLVNLHGLNALLEGATNAYREGALLKLRDEVPPSLVGPVWAAFEPARSKIEAVTRIAALTDAQREWLGPGGKEHKSVFLNLAHALFPGDPRIDMSSKTRLGASLARVLGVPWTDDCASTGETIQLTGLNTILAGAERHLGRLGAQVSDMLATAEAEGDALAAALLSGLPDHWDGRKSVKWLADNGMRGANDNEWQGFFGEERARAVLGASFAPRIPGPRVRYGNTVFDYALNSVWDIKVHTEVQTVAGTSRAASPEMLLNDEQAIRDCVNEQGIGFLIISGNALMDDSGEFLRWHREFKTARRGRPASPSNSGKSRTRKAAFTPLHVESFWLANGSALSAAIASGELSARLQGRQAPKAEGDAGAARGPKFVLNIAKARAGSSIARYDFQQKRRHPS